MAVHAYLALLAILLSGCNRTPQKLSETGFPERTSSSLYLFPEGKKELSRELAYFPDSRVIKSIRVEYADGGSLLVEFRPDGSATMLRQYYPALDGAPVLARSIDYGADGRVIRSAFLREDGSLKAAGRAETSGLFEQLEYAGDGRTIVAQRDFDARGEIVYFRDFESPDNHSEKQTLPNGTTVSVEFREDGTRLSRTLDLGYYVGDQVLFFGDDGVTVTTVVFRKRTISAFYLRPDGSLSQVREFTSGGGMTVTVYGPGVRVDPLDSSLAAPASGAVVRQHWRKNYGSDSQSREFVLERVEQIDAAGKVVTRYKFDNRQMLKGVEYLNSDEKVVESHDLRDDGTVERIYHNQWGDKDYPISTRSEPVDRDAGLKPDVDETLFAPVDATDPRTLVGPPVQQYSYPGCYEGYDYESGYPCDDY